MCYKHIMVAVAKLLVRMSVEEFLNWDSGDGLKYELVDGEPRAMAPASGTHGILQGRLATMINNHLDREKSSCSLVVEPAILPRLMSDHNVRMPDLAVTCSGYRTEETVLSEPVLLVEILSPSNQSKTWSNVWTYTSIPSAQEILVVHSDRIAAELLRRSAEGAWPERPTTIAEGDLVLESIGFRAVLAELYTRTRLVR